MSSKKLLAIGMGAAITIAILVPVLIVAQNNEVTEKAKGFCTIISGLYSKIDQRFSNAQSKLEAKREEISNRIEKRRERRDAKLEEKRARWDVNREEHFTKMEERAQTDEQKQAVVVFHRAVTEAIKARRAAIDGAIQNFRDGVDNVKLLRKSTIDEIVNNFREDVRAAFDKAESDCGSGVSPGTVRQNLHSDLKTAKEKFVNDRQSIEKLSTDMEPLIEAKREAIKKAIEDFKAVIEQARADFKAASGEETSEEE